MKTILAIDDDVMSLEILEEILKDKGFELILFSSAWAAIDFVKSTQLPIDLFLIDFRMEEQTGLEVLKYLKESNREYSKSPMIIVSAISTPYYRDKAIALGAAGYVSKPFEESALFSVIDEYLHDDCAIPT
ncbi:response regulator [bacterium]|nr:response regulator [bacterium]